MTLTLLRMQADIQFKEQGGVAGCMANKHEVSCFHTPQIIVQYLEPAAQSTSTAIVGGGGRGCCCSTKIDIRQHSFAWPSIFHGLSPLYASSAPQLSSVSGKLALHPNAQEPRSSPNATTRGFNLPRQDGLAVLTTHRLVWIDQRKAPAAGATCQVHLETINNVELRSSRKWSHSKLRIQVHLDHEGRPASGIHQPPPSSFLVEGCAWV